MWMISLQALRTALILTMVAQHPPVSIERDLLKNPTMAEQPGGQCLYSPAVTNRHFHHGKNPSACLKGSIDNFHHGSATHLWISPVPSEQPLRFTFFAYTKANNQKLALRVSALGDDQKELRFFKDGPNGPFKPLGLFGQMVGLSPGKWIKVEKTYVVPKGTQTLSIWVDNSDPQDVYIADGTLTIKETAH